MAFRTENHDDTALFKNRLWKLMEEKHLKSSKALAIHLYDQGLITVKSKDSTLSINEPNVIRNNAIGAIEKKINTHLNSEKMTDVKGQFVNAYCKFFEISADYLFGFTSIRTCNPEIRRICELMGLSEKAVLNLVEVAQDREEPSIFSDCWSTLLESDLFGSIPLDWFRASCELTEAEQARAIFDVAEEYLQRDLPLLAKARIDSEFTAARHAKDSHRNAFYGMLYLISLNIQEKMRALVKKELEQKQVYEEESARRKAEYENLEKGLSDDLPNCKGKMAWHYHDEDKLLGIDHANKKQ